MANKAWLSPQHESNLRKLAGYLLSGNLLADFNMHDYGEHSEGVGHTDCGTVGCAAGHGPYAGVEKRDYESWSMYIDRQFGLDRAVSWLCGQWEWCFDSGWCSRDNTPEGAARRVLWLLEHGLPNDWGRQVNGWSERCYQDFEITPEMLDWQAVLN